MNDVEVYVDLSGKTFLVGLARINRARGNETMVFEYDRTWLESTNRFALEPGLPLMRGGFSPTRLQSGICHGRHRIDHPHQLLLGRNLHRLLRRRVEKTPQVIT